MRIYFFLLGIYTSDLKKVGLFSKRREKLRKIGSISYRKVSKFWDTRKLCCNPLKTQTKRPNLRIFFQNEENGIANSEDLDQTAPLGTV